MLKKLSGVSRSAIGRAKGLFKGSRHQSARPKGSKQGASGKKPVVIPADEHGISRKLLSRSALKVLDRLHASGHAAYLVGGGVRDALVGLKPKDFDVATDASPEEIRALFRNSRIIGRRFRLVHVVFGREIIEVATFRAAHDKGAGGETKASGRIVRDNVFGSIEEDARRRDFSVNALYYNIADGSIEDYVGGLDDLNNRVFRLIGDPHVRCAEDPVRVLRAARLAAKLDFDIDKATQDAMRALSSELKSMPPARLFEEVLKLFQGGYALKSFTSIRHWDLLRYLFPLLDERLGHHDEDELMKMLEEALSNTDRRVAQGKPITPAYLLAFMLWPDVEERARSYCQEGLPLQDALQNASDEILATQLRTLSIPRRFSGPMKEIWLMQPRLERSRGGRAIRLMENRRFRAAYDFLCLRAGSDERLLKSAKWWTHVQTLPEEQREQSAAERPVANHIWVSADDHKTVQGSGTTQSNGRSGQATATEVKKHSRGRRRRGRRRRRPGGDKGAAA